LRENRGAKRGRAEKESEPPRWAGRGKDAFHGFLLLIEARAEPHAVAGRAPLSRFIFAMKFSRAPRAKFAANA
jgi:hypothetical protein